MTFAIDSWTRVACDALPLWLSRTNAAWFVPDDEGDALLRSLQSDPRRPLHPHQQKFLNRLPGEPASTYTGRARYLENTHLEELWFHITNACDMACRHCLFASGPAAGPSLSAGFVLDTARQASEMGCSTFALTGGEPFVHPDIREIIDGLLALPESHVIVLTNAKALGEYLDDLHRWQGERFHLQISMDGLQQAHDRIRGAGSFAALERTLSLLRSQGVPFTLSMAVSRHNAADMPKVAAYASTANASSLHYMWYFARGRGTQEAFIDAQRLAPLLIDSAREAEKRSLLIDNIETLKTQIFSPGGTIHDGGGAGWLSAAIGPDARLYPSAATIGIEALAYDIGASLESAWRESPALKRIRTATIAHDSDPWRFYTGGGDFDHSYSWNSSITGADPYIPLYTNVFRWLISREANRYPVKRGCSLRLASGEILESCGTHGGVALTHSNCLLSLSGQTYQSVGAFYTKAAQTDNEDILNPICYPEETISHIPPRFRFRGYGCGSPVIDAAVRTGEDVVDLGCGRGIECFIAARTAGANGSVTGIDMLDSMLTISREGAAEIARSLGYDNMRFRKGYLETLPLEADSADVVLSNCVLNLSPHKRKTFSEVFRVVRPGGRFVASDVVCETDPGPAIRNDTTLKGECIAGALRQQDICGLLEEAGFESIYLIKRFPYRVVQGRQFYSLTFETRKPDRSSPMIKCMYRGPATVLQTDGHTVLAPGMQTIVPRDAAHALRDQVFIFDDHGSIVNMAMQSSCACATPTKEAHEAPAPAAPQDTRHQSGCMVCGAPLRYLTGDQIHSCTYCERRLAANALCANGHFVCDRCHSADALAVITRLCQETTETDLLSLFNKIRNHPAVPVHGPEHHALIPGIIMAGFRNSGGTLPPDIVAAAIQRGSQIAGGSCAFTGVCGAATGVGIAFSLILEANPLKGALRQRVQSAVIEAMKRIAGIEGPRCCLRDGTTALRCAADISREYLPVALKAEMVSPCGQRHLNAECIGRRCPLHSISQGSSK
jgi:MoaA/NifB/PqqE/SkfB family radical SAM enzyme/SAM-dependent methyltransferase